MHVMVAVDASRLSTVKPGEFIELCGHNIFEGISQPGMKDRLAEATRLQVSGDPLLMLEKPTRISSTRELRGEVQVESGVDSPLLSQPCSSLGIVHKRHG